MTVTSRHQLTTLLLAVVFVAASQAQTGSYSSVNDPRPEFVAEAIASVCPAERIVLDHAGWPSGCQVCPKGSGSAGTANNEWNLQKALSGHFLSAHEDNLLISTTGCEPHSLSGPGTFVFRMERDKPEVVNYVPGLITSQCTKAKLPDSRDTLVCQASWGAQMHEWQFVYAVRFATDGKPVLDRLSQTEDTRMTCGQDEDGEKRGTVIMAQIKAVNLALDRDGMLSGVIVDAYRWQRRLPAAEAKACREGRAFVSITPAKPYKVNFTFDGKHFSVTPETAYALKAFPEPSFPDIGEAQTE